MITEREGLEMESKYYEVHISVEQVFSYKVEANNEIEAEEKAVNKLRCNEYYEQVIDSSGAIDEITEEEFHEY